MSKNVQKQNEQKCTKTEAWIRKLWDEEAMKYLMLEKNIRYILFIKKRQLYQTDQVIPYSLTNKHRPSTYAYQQKREKRNALKYTLACLWKRELHVICILLFLSQILANKHGLLLKSG